MQRILLSILLTLTMYLVAACDIGYAQGSAPTNTDAMESEESVTDGNDEEDSTSIDDTAEEADEPKSTDDDAADDAALDAAKPIYWATRSMEMRFGLTFNSGDNNCTALHATVPFP